MATEHGHSSNSFEDAAKDAAKKVHGKATFTITEQSGEISPNPGTINLFTVTLDVTPQP